MGIKWVGVEKINQNTISTSMTVYRSLLNERTIEGNGRDDHRLLELSINAIINDEFTEGDGHWKWMV